MRHSATGTAATANGTATPRAARGVSERGRIARHEPNRLRTVHETSAGGLVVDGIDGPREGQVAALFGFTPGQYACGLKVVALDSPGRQGGVGLIRAVVRGLLIALLIPALFIDADGRGLQDRATMTAVLRR